ncbi:hypothetical protein IMCC26207_108164 [Actinobacteria bacterium IMCC26207]|nr:hypothetical protein IMCC26207_108164 [Actinobacteria bacterium IMCC26207]
MRVRVPPRVPGDCNVSTFQRFNVSTFHRYGGRLLSRSDRSRRRWWPEQWALEEGGVAMSVEAGRPAATVTAGRACCGSDELVGLTDLAPEVGWVEWHIPDRFVDRSQICDREFRRQEGRGQCRVLELGPGAIEAVVQDLVVVEGQGRAAQSGLLEELTFGGVANRLAVEHEATGQRPTITERSQRTLHQQDVQLVLADGEDDEIDGNCDIGGEYRLRPWRHAPGPEISQPLAMSWLIAFSP